MFYELKNSSLNPWDNKFHIKSEIPYQTFTIGFKTESCKSIQFTINISLEFMVFWLRNDKTAPINQFFMCFLLRQMHENKLKLILKQFNAVGIVCKCYSCGRHGFGLVLNWYSDFDWIETSTWKSNSFDFCPENWLIKFFNQFWP